MEGFIVGPTSRLAWKQYHKDRKNGIGRYRALRRLLTALRAIIEVRLRYPS